MFPLGRVVNNSALQLLYNQGWHLSLSAPPSSWWQDKCNINHHTLKENDKKQWDFVKNWAFFSNAGFYPEPIYSTEVWNHFHKNRSELFKSSGSRVRSILIAFAINQVILGKLFNAQSPYVWDWLISTCFLGLLWGWSDTYEQSPAHSTRYGWLLPIITVSDKLCFMTIYSIWKEYHNGFNPNHQWWGKPFDKRVTSSITQ